MGKKNYSDIRFNKLDDGTEIIFLDGEDTQIYQYRDLGDYYALIFPEGDEHVCRIFPKKPGFESWQNTSMTLESFLDSKGIEAKLPKSEREYVDGFEPLEFNLDKNLLSYSTRDISYPASFTKYQNELNYKRNGSILKGGCVTAVIGAGLFLSSNIFNPGTLVDGLFDFLFMVYGVSTVIIPVLPAVIMGLFNEHATTKKGYNICKRSKRIIKELSSTVENYNTEYKKALHTQNFSRYNKSSYWLTLVRNAFVDHIYEYNPTGFEVRYTAKDKDQINEFLGYFNGRIIPHKPKTAEVAGADGEFGSLEEVAQYRASRR